MFKSPSKHSDDLLRVIIQRIEACLRTDLNRSPPTLESSRRHLKLASYLVVEKRLANPHPLLLLYIPFTSRPKLSRLPKPEQTSLLRDLTGILAAAEATYSATHHEPLLQQINIALNATPIIVEVMRLWFSKIKHLNLSVCRAYRQAPLNRLQLKLMKIS